MWKKDINEKYRIVVSKMVNWAKMDQLAKCVYFVLTENGFLISEIDRSYDMRLDSYMGVLVRYQYFWYLGF